MYLDHINRLDNASSKHTRGTAIDEGLDSVPDTNWVNFLLLRHLFLFLTDPNAKPEKKRFRGEKERERDSLGGEEMKK